MKFTSSSGFELSADVGGTVLRLVPFAPLQNVKLSGLKDDVKAQEVRLRKLKVSLFSPYPWSAL